MRFIHLVALCALVCSGHSNWPQHPNHPFKRNTSSDLPLLDSVSDENAALTEAANILLNVRNADMVLGAHEVRKVAHAVRYTMDNYEGKFQDPATGLSRTLLVILRDFDQEGQNSNLTCKIDLVFAETRNRTLEVLRALQQYYLYTIKTNRYSQPNAIQILKDKCTSNPYILQLKAVRTLISQTSDNFATRCLDSTQFSYNNFQILYSKITQLSFYMSVFVQTCFEIGVPPTSYEAWNGNVPGIFNEIQGLMKEYNTYYYNNLLSPGLSSKIEEIIDEYHSSNATNTIDPKLQGLSNKFQSMLDDEYNDGYNTIGAVFWVASHEAMNSSTGINSKSEVDSFEGSYRDVKYILHRYSINDDTHYPAITYVQKHLNAIKSRVQVYGAGFPIVVESAMRVTRYIRGLYDFPLTTTTIFDLQHQNSIFCTSALTSIAQVSDGYYVVATLGF